MKTKKLVASLLLLCTVTMLSAQNMSRYITMTVKEGCKITLVLFADADNTPVKVVSGGWDTVCDIHRYSSSTLVCLAKSRTMTVYGNVITFDCDNSGNVGNISFLDVSTNTLLMKLRCSSLKSLVGVTLGKNSLIDEIQCINNNISALDVSQLTALELLNCSGNNLSVLNLRNCTKLNQLYCNGNKLSALDVSQNLKLKWLNCASNDLARLDVSHNVLLQELWCADNPLTNLNLCSNTALSLLHCAICRLTELDLSCNGSLKTLNCAGNSLAALDLGRNRSLSNLYCYDCGLQSLDVEKNTMLVDFYCYGNHFATKAWDAIMCSLPMRNASDNACFCPLKNADDSSYAVFMGANAKNAGAKSWRVLYENGKQIPATSGKKICGLDVNMDKSITLQVKRGSYISFDCRGSNEATPILVVSGTRDTVIRRGTSMGGRVSFAAGADTMTIYGDVNGLDCRSNGKNLTGIDIVHNPSLQLLSCPFNSLTRLDVGGCDSLKYLYCLGNPFTTQAFDDIMCKLPAWKDADGAKLHPLENDDDPNYEEFMASNSENAKSKNWSVTYWNGNNDIPATNGKFDCAALSVREATAASALRIWPNPARTQLHIAGAEGELRVHDLTGRVVYRAEAGNDDIVVNIADWAKGMYFVRSGCHTLKFVKE